MRRTTILLDDEDVENLSAVAQELRTTDTDAIRRALRLTRELLDWERHQGGSVILEKGRRRERIRFV